MASLNEVRLIGNLTRDPVMKMTPAGQQVAELGMAINRKYRGQDGVLREEVTYVDITCWGKIAETVSKYMRKGRMVFVGGRLKFDSWEDKQTGQKRNKLRVVAENVQFLDRREDMSTTPAGEISEDPTYHVDHDDWGPRPTTPIPPTDKAKPPSWEPPVAEEPSTEEPPF